MVFIWSRRWNSAYENSHTLTYKLSQCKYIVLKFVLVFLLLYYLREKKSSWILVNYENFFIPNSCFYFNKKLKLLTFNYFRWICWKGCDMLDRKNKYATHNSRYSNSNASSRCHGTWKSVDLILCLLMLRIKTQNVDWSVSYGF